jgi:TRAP-type C4-dicarboxylate transport system permease small subunit
MSETDNMDTRPTDPVGRALLTITRWFALTGGLVLCAMAVLTTVSVTGRRFFDAPVTGDFELIAIGTGVCVFAFLPYCQIKRENVLVDFFMSAAPDRVKSFFDAIANLTYTLIIALMIWRMCIGGLDLYEADEMTLILEFGRWWTFPAAIICLLLLLVVCAYTFVCSVKEVRRT